MKKLFEFLREQTMKIINFKKKKMKLLTKGIVPAGIIRKCKNLLYLQINISI